MRGLSMVRSLPLLIALMAIGCQNVAHEAGEPAPTRSPALVLDADGLPLLRHVTGDDASLDQPALLLITSDEEARALGAEEILAIPVDYAANDLLVVALGAQPTAGYAVAITGVQQGGDTLFVQVQVTEPEDVAAQVITYPFAAAVIPSTGATLLVAE